MLGAVINYCSSNPPDATTVALLAARGDSANVQACAYSTGQPNLPTNAGIHPANQTNAPAAPTPYTWGSYPGQENCQPLDSACVQRNTQREVDYQNNFYIQQANYNRQQCYANRVANNQQIDGCDELWPPGQPNNTPVAMPEQVIAYNTGGTGNPTTLVPPATQTPNRTTSIFGNGGTVGTTPTTGVTTMPSLPGGLTDTLNNVVSATGLSTNMLLLGAAGLVAFMMLRK